jgi:hypothetical protein
MKDCYRFEVKENDDNETYHLIDRVTKETCEAYDKKLWNEATEKGLEA